MENLAQIKRKHFRFPAYDDELGVKLNVENKRTLFKDDMLLSSAISEPVDNQKKAPIQAVEPALDEQKKTYSQEKKEELTRHKLNLPDYAMTWNKTASNKKKNLFGDLHKRNYEVPRTTSQSVFGTNKMTVSKNYESAKNGRFVPTYVPASVISDEKTETTISEETLVRAMKKNSGSYLLFDEEPAAFQVKKSEDDPTVKKFNIPKGAPEIPVTRRQYQQIKPDMARFGNEDLEETLPRSRKELKSAKEKAKNQAPYTQKIVEDEQEKKRSILDKSLSMLIQDSNEEHEHSDFFK